MDNHIRMGKFFTDHGLHFISHLMGLFQGQGFIQLQMQLYEFDLAGLTGAQIVNPKYAFVPHGNGFDLLPVLIGQLPVDQRLDGFVADSPGAV